MMISSQDLFKIMFNIFVLIKIKFGGAVVAAIGDRCHGDTFIVAMVIR